ncbi:hypothetical protein C7212DRAFT_234572, partial [Tuber magnatum]
NEAMFTQSSSRWSNNDTRFTWLSEFFHPHTQSPKPNVYRLFLIDGHSSHLTYEFISFAFHYQSWLLCFHCHAIHRLQPPNICIFSLLQCYYG